MSPRRASAATLAAIGLAALSVFAVSLTGLGAAPRFSREANIDRSGNDIRREVLAADAPVEACEALCAATADCHAFTFVKQSTSVPKPICWLKDTVPFGHASNCCTSGVRQP